MSAKIDKVCAEINKTKAKISDYQARLRELEKQKTELENIELAAFIKAFREKNGTPVSLGKEDAGYEANDNDL